jgi:hypothetical protein
MRHRYGGRTAYRSGSGCRSGLSENFEPWRVVEGLQGTPYRRLATKGSEKCRLVVGGYALAFHGFPRYTKDIDFWVWVNEENAKNLVITLKEFGFPSLDLKEDDF